MNSNVIASPSLEEAEAILHRLSHPEQQRHPGMPGARSHPAVEAYRVAPRTSTDETVFPAALPSAIGVAGDLFRSVLDCAPDAMIVVNQEGRIVLVNSQTERLFGYPRQELLGQPVEILVPEPFRGEHVRQRDGYFANPRRRPMGLGMELNGRHKTGSEFPVEISLSPLMTDDGLLVISAIRDLSERKRAEAQLRKAEARYRTLVEEIPAVTFMAALDEGINELYVSPQIEELLGFTAKEWLEDPVLWYRQLHPADQERWHTEFARTCVSAEPFSSEYRFIARDGSVVWVQGEAKVVRDEDGRPLFLQGVAFDITERKRAEEALRALNQTLEERVAERTALVEQQAQELARSNADLDEFARVASHDLKEPLRTVSTFTQKMAKSYQDKLDATAGDWIDRIVNGARFMHRLVEELYYYAKVGREGKITPTDCNQVFAAVCGNLRVAFEECGAVVTAGALPTLPAVETEIMRLFQNLIGNAIKFRGEQPPRVHVAALRQDNEWLFSIRDNGIGIEPQYWQKIFGIGQKSRLHSRSRYPGTGFGLGFCKKIVEHHGGRIWLNSEPGAGSTFSFTLPAERPATA